MCEQCETGTTECAACGEHEKRMTELLGGRAWTNADVAGVVKHLVHLTDDLLAGVDENSGALFPDLAEETANGMKLIAASILSHGMLLHMAGRRARAHIAGSN